MLTKAQTAQILADAHFQLDPDLTQIFRLVEKDEENRLKPVKLLEVSSSTTADGIVPIGMTADPGREIYYPVVIVEIAPDELDKVRRAELRLPEGWSLADELFPTKSAAAVIS